MKAFDTENKWQVKNHHFVSKGIWGTHGVKWINDLKNPTIIGYEKIAMLFKFVVGYSHSEKFLSVGSISFLDVVHKIKIFFGNFIYEID